MVRQLLVIELRKITPESFLVRMYAMAELRTHMLAFHYGFLPYIDKITDLANHYKTEKRIST